jgi:hypothetical protein
VVGFGYDKGLERISFISLPHSSMAEKRRKTVERSFSTPLT